MLGPWYEGLQLPMAEHSQPVQPYHILQSVPENIIMFFFSIIDDIQLQKNAMWTETIERNYWERKYGVEVGVPVYNVASLPESIALIPDLPVELVVRHQVNVLDPVLWRHGYEVTLQLE